MSRKNTKVFVFAMGFLILFFGWQSVMRNLVWQKNITLFADVVKKSPRFPVGHNEYGIALQKAGKIEEARREFTLAWILSDKTTSFNALAAVNAAALDGEEAFEKVVGAYLAEKNLPRKERIKLLKKLADRLNKQLRAVSEDRERVWILEKSLDIHRELYRKTKDSFHLYREGQLHLALGEKDMARECFEKVCRHTNAFYTNTACKLYQELVEEQ
jgi:tetratricopeptide (TPR) repeat protein